MSRLKVFSEGCIIQKSILDENIQVRPLKSIPIKTHSRNNKKARIGFCASRVSVSIQQIPEV